MKRDQVEEIKAKLDIVEVIGGHVQLRRSGREHTGLCPFHNEKSPSFTVSQERQAWYCFGCQEGGDLFTFIQRIDNVDFSGALELLAERAGVTLERDARDPGRGERRARIFEINARAQAFYEHVLWKTEAGAAGRALLAERGVGDDAAGRFGLGFAPAGGARGDALVRYLLAKHFATLAETEAAGLCHPPERGSARDRFRHRLTFPIRDERGRVLGFGARALSDAKPKYLNTPATAVYDKSTAFFGIDRARQAMLESKTAVIVEGYFDVMAAHAAGVENVVASSGTALAAAQARLLTRYVETVVLCFDGDAAGRAAAERALDLLAPELRVQLVVLPDGAKDPDELEQRRPGAFARCVATAPDAWSVLVDQAIGDAEGMGSLERHQAVERVAVVLARIAAATARDAHLEAASNRLRVDSELLRGEVERRRRRSTARPVAGTGGGEQAAAVTGLLEAATGHALSAWEERLTTLLLARPELMGPLVKEHGLVISDLQSPTLRAICHLAGSVPRGARFPVEQLDEADRQVATRLQALVALRPPPELSDGDDPAPLEQMLADCVHRVRLATLEAEISAVRWRLRQAADQEQLDEQLQLAARLGDLASQMEQVRRGAPAVGRSTGGSTSS